MVKFYNAAKGYGFVVPDDGGRDVFLHGSVLNRAGVAALEPGQRVSVMVEQGARGLQAMDVELIRAVRWASAQQCRCRLRPALLAAESAFNSLAVPAPGGEERPIRPSA